MSDRIVLYPPGMEALAASVAAALGSVPAMCTTSIATPAAVLCFERFTSDGVRRPPPPTTHAPAHHPRGAWRRSKYQGAAQCRAQQRRGSLVLHGRHRQPVRPVVGSSLLAADPRPAAARRIRGRQVEADGGGRRVRHRRGGKHHRRRPMVPVLPDGAHLPLDGARGQVVQRRADGRICRHPDGDELRGATVSDAGRIDDADPEAAPLPRHPRVCVAPPAQLAAAPAPPLGDEPRNCAARARAQTPTCSARSMRRASG